MTPRDKDVLLDDIKLAAHNIAAFTKDFDETSFTKNLMAISSVCYQLAIIGEAANKLPQAFVNQHPDLPWRQIVGLRNHLVHAYHDVKTNLIWQAATVEVPKLIRQLNL